MTTIAVMSVAVSVLALFLSIGLLAFSTSAKSTVRVQREALASNLEVQASAERLLTTLTQGAAPVALDESLRDLDVLAVSAPRNDLWVWAKTARVSSKNDAFWVTVQLEHHGHGLSKDFRRENQVPEQWWQEFAKTRESTRALPEQFRESHGLPVLYGTGDSAPNTTRRPPSDNLTGTAMRV